MLPSSKEEERSSSGESAWKWFIGFTSIGGLNQSNLTDLKISRIFWMLLFVIGSILTVYAVVLVLCDFYSYPVTTTMVKKYNETLEYPALTFCNNNKVHCRNLNTHIIQLKNESSIQNKARIDLLCRIYAIGRCLIALGIDDLFLIGQHQTPDACPNGTHEYDNVQVDDAALLLLGLLDNLLQTDRFAIAHQAHQLFKQCRFQSLPATRSCQELILGNTRMISPSAGVCYSFNYNQSDDLTAALSGENYGLELEIDVDSRNNLLRGLTESTGVRVIIHEPKKNPMITTQGNALRTGTLNKLALETVQLERQPPPYTSMCRDKWGEQQQQQQFLYNMPYQDHLCQSFCLDEFIQARCNCTTTAFIEIDRKMSNFCNYAIPENARCINNIRLKSDSFLRELNQHCVSCQPQCREINYQVTPSQSVWPSSGMFWLVLAEKYNVSFNGSVIKENVALEQLFNLSNEFDPLLAAAVVEPLREMQKAMEENYLKVQVFFSSKTVTTVAEMPTYNAMALLTTLGGALSFYLGFSIVSLFEVGELLIRFLVGLVNNRNGH